MTGIVLVFLRVYTGIAVSLLIMISFVIFLSFITRKRGKQLMAFMLTVFMTLFLGGYFVMYRAGEMSYDRSRCSFECKVHRVTRDLEGNCKVRVYCREYGFLEFKVPDSDITPVSGDVLDVSGTLYVPDKPRNPGQFDYGSYLARKGIELAFYPESISIGQRAPTVMLLAGSCEERLYELRIRILDFYGDEAPLAGSVFMGDSSLTPDNERTLYNRNGCAHILAVSGTHFAGFLSVITYLSGKMRRTKFNMPLYISLCICLGAFTGWSSSVTRACVMCSASYSSRDPLSGLSAACIMLMVADPYNALSYGFLMTCSASLAILYITPRLQRKLDHSMGKKMSSVISPALAAQAGMLPFILITSQRYGLIPILVQTVTSFVASVACTFFIPSVLLSFIISPVFIEPSRILLLLLDSIVHVADRCYTGFTIPYGTALILISLIFLLLYRNSAISRFMRLPIAVLLLISIVSGVFGYVSSASAKIIFIDVGQGDSCLVMCSGKTVLIDGGTYEAGEDDVLPVLEYYDIRHIDITIATHWDRDHIGGLLYLYNAGVVESIYTSYVGEGPKQIDIMSEYLPDTDIADVFRQICRGDRISVSDDCRIDVLYPASTYVTCGENEDSLLMRLQCEETSILLTGDLGIDEEDLFLQDESIGKTDILKAGHHGSGYSTGIGLLEDTMPEVAIISAGVDNPYGHPSPITLDRLEEYDVTVVSTQSMGAITVEIYPDRFSIRGYLNDCS